MSRRVKRWRLSDVVHAMSRAAGDRVGWSDLLQREAAWCAKEHGVREVLVGWDNTLPRLLGMRGSEWLALTDEQREAAIVAEARRLKVPRRG